MNTHNKVRDLKRRIEVDNHRFDRTVRKTLRREPSMRDAAHNRISSLPRNTSPVRLVNRCTQSGFARSQRAFGLSRFEIRRQCRLGMLPGVVKAIW